MMPATFQRRLRTFLSRVEAGRSFRCGEGVLRRLALPVALSGVLLGGGAAWANTFSAAWRKPIPALASLAISPTGRAAAVVYRDNRVHVFDEEGRLLWGVTFPQTPKILLSDEGEAGLAYFPQNSRRKTVTLLKEEKPYTRYTFTGAVTSAALGPEGEFGAAATENRSLHLFRRNRERTGYSRTRHRLKSVPRTLLAPTSNLVLVGYRGEAGVEAYNSRGRLLWRLPGRERFVYDLYAAPGGDALGVLEYRSGSGDEARAYVIEPDGSLVWKTQLPGVYPLMALEAGAAGAAISYTEVLRSGGRTRYAHKISYHDAQGRQEWEKGGLFFSPRLVGVLSPGPAVIARGPSALFIYGERGAVEGMMRPRSPFIRQEVSRNGRSIIAWGQDSALYYLRWKG